MNEVIKNLVRLAEENPELPIVAMVDGEIVGGDNYARWLGSVGNVELGEYVLFDDRFIDDREEFKERYYDYNDDELCEKFGYEPGVNEFRLENGCCTQRQYDENKENEKHLEAYLDEVAERAFIPAIIVNIDLPKDIETFEEGVSIDE